jgi:hypothetical protein
MLAVLSLVEPRFNIDWFSMIAVLSLLNLKTKKKLCQTRGSPIKLRLYSDFFNAPLRLHQGSITALLRV